MQHHTAAAQPNAHVHPVMAEAISRAAAIPTQLRRADYVARLARLDRYVDLGPECSHMVRDEEQRLRLVRAEIDPTGELWNKHAPIQFRDASQVHTFIDFTGTCPVTVEWVQHPTGVQVIAVVVEHAQGPKTIHQDLSIAALSRYQLQAETLARTHQERRAAAVEQLGCEGVAA